MALSIYWNRRASNKFDKIAEYLLENWGMESARKFAYKVYDVIELLKAQPEIGSLQHLQKNIRGIVIVEQVTLFYKVQNNKIILINFFTNYQDPKKRF